SRWLGYRSRPGPVVATAPRVLAAPPNVESAAHLLPRSRPATGPPRRRPGPIPEPIYHPGRAAITRTGYRPPPVGTGGWETREQEPRRVTANSPHWRPAGASEASAPGRADCHGRLNGAAGAPILTAGKRGA